jgi:hypothetical protein
MLYYTVDVQRSELRHETGAPVPTDGLRVPYFSAKARANPMYDRQYVGRGPYE